VRSNKRNGGNGIPYLNYFGWIYLATVVVLLYQYQTRTKEVENIDQPQRQLGGLSILQQMRDTWKRPGRSLAMHAL
jgi:uncharacterized membrane protein